MAIQIALGPWLAGLFGSLITWFITNIGALAGRVAIALGFGYVVYEQVDFVIDEFESYIIAQRSQLEADILAFADLVGLDVCLKMVVAAYTAQIAIRVSLGAFRKFTSVPQS
jgi:hypothetical protein